MHEASSKHTKLIMDTAVELFKRQGYEAVSVNDICKAAGIARSSFYLVFSGKKDIIDRLLADVRLSSDELVRQLITAPNDYERMWVLCCRYLDVALNFGPELLGSLLRLELMGELDLLGEVHRIDDWMTELGKNCKAMGIIRSPEPAEVIVPLSVSMVYFLTYEWCKCGGDFSLKDRARHVTESVLNVAEEYRWNKNRYGDEPRD
ncbi:MAG: TetR/AcrR family transcriptional regulator [Oscillospiraceae bacterium]|nr:TetR/AcrR family transcriptional regulator [Oscillospiraceae bacterium]